MTIYLWSECCGVNTHRWGRSSMRCNDIDHVLHLLADYLVLEKLTPKRTTATRLDGRACRCIDAQAFNGIDIAQFCESERRLFDALKRKA